MIVGVIAITGVLITWQQKNTADRRSEWWRRVTWAFERIFSLDDTQAALGWRVLTTLFQSKLVTRGDFDVVQAMAEHTALVDDSKGAATDGNDR